MRIHFSNSTMNMGMETETYTLEVHTDNNKQIHTLQTVPVMAVQQFQNLIIQATRSSQAVKIRIVKHIEVWSNIDQKVKSIENSLEFRNRAYGDND